MKISAVRFFQVSGPIDTPAPEQRQLQMPDIYPDYAARGPHTPTGRATHTHVEIETDDGATGLFGPIFDETVPIIRAKLRPHLLGQDPMAYERIWDVLYRQDRHARKGYEMMAISAVDNALWDLRSKAFGQPIYKLLGGPTRERVDCYASLLGSSLEPERVAQRAREVVALGYKAQKWFFRNGPGQGLEGMDKNVELVRTVREAVGPNVEIMFDFFMGADATYVIRLAERIAEYRPRWLEEPVPPDRIGDFATIRRATRIPLATGEHEYTRWGFLQLLQNEAVDVIQADPDWCGGITELVKICTLASAFGKHVIPHGHSIHAAVHLIAAQSPAVCPMAEYLIRSQQARQPFLKTRLAPESGSFPLPTAPGLGIDIDESKIDERRELE